MLTVACVVCAAAIAALPGPGANANRKADAAKIVSALSVVPKAVTSWDKTTKEQQAKEQQAKERQAKERQEQRAKAARKACARPAALPPVGLKLTEPPGCAAPVTVPTAAPTG